MKRILLLCFFINGCILHSAPEPEHALDAYLKRITAGENPGFAVMVLKDGEKRFSGVYGYRELAGHLPVNLETRFELASVSKQFTAMAVMLLAEEGRLDYEDRLVKFLPELSPLTDGISIRNLMQHTAGLPEYFHLCENGKQLTNADVLAYVATQTSLEFTPGSSHSYSNTAYSLLAMVVERASGESYPVFMRRRLFERLGMSSTFVNEWPRPAGENIAVAYSKGPDYTPQLQDSVLHCNTIYGDGSIFSTVSDLVHWHQALDEGTLVKAATLKEAFSPGKTTAGKAFDYGFGWRLDKVVGVPAIHHSGSWAGYHNFTARFENGFRAIVLSNYESSPTMEVVKKIREVYFP